MLWLLILVIVVHFLGPIRSGCGAGLRLGTPLFFLVATGVWLLAAGMSWLWLWLLPARCSPRRPPLR